MNILITGSSGYIGSKLVEKLLDKNLNKIYCIDNLMFNQKSNLENHPNNPKIDFINGDVRDINLLKPILKKVDLIIPLAALVGAPLCAKMPKETEEINFLAIKNLCKVLSKDQRVIMPVTNSGYGIGKKDEVCDEKSPLNPISLYGKTKVQAENEVMNRENSISFRLATVFGVSQRMRTDLLVNNFTYVATKEKYLKLYEPHFRRNYIHVLDVINGFNFGIDNFDKLKNNIFNLGLSEANLTKEQLCNEIKKVITDFNFEISNDGFDEDKRDYFVSNQKVEKLGFKAQVPLKKGITELFEYFKNTKNTFNNNY